MADNVLLDVKDLRVYFYMDEGVVRAVDGIDLTIKHGQTIGLVGESGCGKSVTAYSLLQIVAKPGRVVGGQILLHRPPAKNSERSEDGGLTRLTDIAKLDPRSREMRAIRGAEMAMIFQEPMTSLSMMHTVGFQIIEGILLHQEVTKAQAQEQAIAMLRRVGIPRPEERVDAYPFQLSGGMRQRAMIAMALACNPRLLIADEPTTALDVTTQAQIMELIRELQKDLGMSVLLITHDLGVIAEMCEQVLVMYLGEVAERADVKQLFRDPLHPYSRALLRSIPRLGHGRNWDLEPIEGAVPDPYNRPGGCPFHPRCADFIAGTCDVAPAPMIEMPDGRGVRCHLYAQSAKPS